MKILSAWLRSFLPVLDVDDAQLAEDLTLRGIAVEGLFELYDQSGDSDGTLFDVDLTTNRVDAMNHYGIAREAAAIYNVALHPLATALPAAMPGEPFPVRIAPDAEAVCGRFTAQLLRGVRIAPSTGETAQLFAHLGQKPISNAVDATNYVLLAMGQPTHAFDADKIDGGLLVRHAFAGEPLALLDGSTRTLTADDLVIADERKALSLAGVMGGASSMITAETKNIVVEAAWFDPATIRASSRRHLIHTDASHRFERGADFAAAPLANALVCKHILAACGGALAGPMTDLILPASAALTAGRAPVTLSVAHTQKLLGTTLNPEGITSALIERYLQALGCALEPLDDDRFAVTLPSWRLDLAREIDLIEEVARVYGYNGFANTLPSAGITVAHPRARAEQAVRERLYGLGYSEAISSTFASAPDSAAFAPQAAAVALENPLSEDAANLRPSLLPGMVDMLAGNLTRDVPGARLFEAGAIFAGDNAQVHETLALSLGLMGDVPAAAPLHLAKDAPFYELKGVLESLLALFTTEAVSLIPSRSAIFEQGRAADVLLAGKRLASFGQLALAQAARRKIRQPLYVAELDLAALLAHPLRQTVAQEISRFQAVDRDFSFLFPDAVRWGDIEAAILALGIAELQTLRPIEIWRDPAKFPGLHATLLRTTFQSPSRTLTESDLTGWWSSIIAALQALGGTIRDH